MNYNCDTGTRSQDHPKIRFAEMHLLAPCTSIGRINLEVNEAESLSNYSADALSCSRACNMTAKTVGNDRTKQLNRENELGAILTLQAVAKLSCAGNSYRILKKL